MTYSQDLVDVSADDQMQAHSQQFDVNLVCGPKPLAMTLKYLRFGCVGGWSAQTVTTVMLSFLPTLQQRAFRKRDKLNAQGGCWLPMVMPALRVLDEEIRSHAELSCSVSSFLSKILQSKREDLGNFICIFISALQKLPFSVQQSVMVPAMESMLANQSDLVINLFANDASSASTWANALPTTWAALTPNQLKNGMRVHFRCKGIQNGKIKNLRVGHDGRVDGYGWFGAQATWTVSIVGEHVGVPVVTLHADVKDQSRYLHVAEDGTVETCDSDADCKFLMLPQDESCVALQSYSKSSLRVRVADVGAKDAEMQFHFSILPEQKNFKNMAARYAKQTRHEVHQNVSNSEENNLVELSCSDLKDGVRVHFRCMSVVDSMARNLRVGEVGCVEGCGRRGARATWTVGLVGQFEGAPIVTLCVHVKGQVSYLRVTEDGKTIDGQGTGDSHCHFIVRTHNPLCVELQWLGNPSMKVGIGSSGQALDLETACEDEQQVRFMMLSAADSEKMASRPFVGREVVSRTTQANGWDAPSTRATLGPEEIQSGMKVHICCLGRTGVENRNLRVRSDGDVEGRGGFGARATWIVHAVDQHEGAVALALRAHIDGQSWYLRASDNGSKVDGRGTGGPDCMFSVQVSDEGKTLGLYSLLWPAAKLMVGSCGKLLDPLGEDVHEHQAFKLLCAFNSVPTAAAPQEALTLVGMPRSAAPTGDFSNSLRMTAKDLKDGLQVHLKCMSRLHEKASNLRVGEDGRLEGHGGSGPRATWTVSCVGECGGAPVVKLCVHVKGQASYLRVASTGDKVDGSGTGCSDCHFIATMQGDSCVGLRCLANPSVRVRIGSSGEALDPCAQSDNQPEQFSFTILSAATKHLAHRVVCASRSLRQVPAEPRQLAHKTQSFQDAMDTSFTASPLWQCTPSAPNEVMLQKGASGPLVHPSPDKKLEVLPVHALCDGLRVHLQCNGRRGAQRQNLRLCSNGDVEGLGMFGNPATWTLHTAGENSGSPVVTLHSELQGIPRYLRLAKEGPKIDARGHGGVECQFMVKTEHFRSSAGMKEHSCTLHPVISPLARLGVGADGTLLDPSAAESDLQFSFSLLLSRHSDSPDWELVEEVKNYHGNRGKPTKIKMEITPQEWSVLDSKEWQLGDDW